MAVKAVGGIVNLARATSDPTKFRVGLTVGILDSGGGFGGSRTMYIDELGTGLLTIGLVSAIESALKTWCQGEGVSFGLGDTVALIPGSL